MRAIRGKEMLCGALAVVALAALPAAARADDEDAKKLFPNGYTAVKPYLRVTKQPNA